MQQNHRNIGGMRVKVSKSIIIPPVIKEYNTEVKCHVTEEFMTSWINTAINAKFNEFDIKISELSNIGELIRDSLKSIKDELHTDMSEYFTEFQKRVHELEDKVIRGAAVYSNGHMQIADSLLEGMEPVPSIGSGTQVFHKEKDRE